MAGGGTKFYETYKQTKFVHVKKEKCATDRFRSYLVKVKLGQQLRQK